MKTQAVCQLTPHQQQVNGSVVQAQANLSFIDLLNSDCLTLIFQAVKSNFPGPVGPTPHQIHDRNRELVRLRQVRRGWRDLIDSEPCLWNSVAFVMGDRASMESASMFLQHSQTAAVHLYGHGGSTRSTKRTRKLARRLKEQLQAASDRIVSFHLIEPNPAMLRLWPASAPNLKEMVIRTRTSFPQIFSDEMPLLRSIVTPVINHHQFLMTQHLTSLILYPPYTLEILLATLENTPMLRTLGLHGVFEDAYGDLPRVLLPNLEELFLSDCYHPIIEFIGFPEHTRITVSVPDHLTSGLSWHNIDAASSSFIPPVFLRSSTLTIIAKKVRHPTEVRFVGQQTGGTYKCRVYIDLREGSSVEHRYGVCVYAMRMVRNMTSVSSLRFDAWVSLPAKYTTFFKHFRNLKVLTLSGPFMCQILFDMVSAETDVVPLLERLVLDQKFMPIYREFNNWLFSRERDGRQRSQTIEDSDSDQG